MVFFMVAAQSFNSLAVDTNLAVYWVIALVVILAVEANAMIGTGQGRQKPLSTVKGTIHMGLLLWVALYVLMVAV
jgi:hypothetical protein